MYTVYCFNSGEYNVSLSSAKYWSTNESAFKALWFVVILSKPRTFINLLIINVIITIQRTRKLPSTKFSKETALTFQWRRKLMKRDNNKKCNRETARLHAGTRANDEHGCRSLRSVRVDAMYPPLLARTAS